MTLEPYLFFKGNCAEAMEFYKSVFGGELTTSKYSDAPAGVGLEVTDENKDWLMHASLKGDVNLMASDTPKASPEMKKVSLSLGGTDEAKMRKMFEALADGGKVFMPLEKMFWGDVHGSLTDKFGVEWSFNIGTAS